jgi:hypothetical protein
MPHRSPSGRLVRWLACAGLAAVALAALAGAAQIHIVHFKSPSGNINCMLVTGEGPPNASCLVKKAAWPHLRPKPASCDLDWDPTELELGGTRLFVGSCRGDIGPLCTPTGEDACRVLAYGRAATLGPIRCLSAAAGVTCRRTDGRRVGFRIAREGYVLYR